MAFSCPSGERGATLKGRPADGPPPPCTTLAGLDGMTPVPDRHAFRSRSPLDEIAFFEPPNYRKRARPSTDLTSRCGIVATVNLHEEHFTPDALPHTVTAVGRLRDGLPRVPLLAFLPEWPASPRRSLVRGIRSLPVRAVLPGKPPPSLEELRDILTSRAGLLEDLRKWFRAHVALDPDELQAGLSLVATGLEASPTDPLPRSHSPGVNRGGGGPPIVAHAGQGDQGGLASPA